MIIEFAKKISNQEAFAKKEVFQTILIFDKLVDQKIWESKQTFYQVFSKALGKLFQYILGDKVEICGNNTLEYNWVN